MRVVVDVAWRRVGKTGRLFLFSVLISFHMNKFKLKQLPTGFVLCNEAMEQTYCAFMVQLNHLDASFYDHLSPSVISLLNLDGP